MGIFSGTIEASVRVVLNGLNVEEVDNSEDFCTDFLREFEELMKSWITQKNNNPNEVFSVTPSRVYLSDTPHNPHISVDECWVPNESVQAQIRNFMVDVSLLFNGTLNGRIAVQASNEDSACEELNRILENSPDTSDLIEKFGMTVSDAFEYSDIDWEINTVTES